MTHKYCFKALDRTLNDIMNMENESRTIFGGKVIVFVGVFRQILPVIPGGKDQILFTPLSTHLIFGITVIS